MKSLPSYDDQNIYMENVNGTDSYVLKLHNILLNDQNVAKLEVQNYASDLLRKNGTSHRALCLLKL